MAFRTVFPAIENPPPTAAGGVGWFVFGGVSSVAAVLSAAGVHSVWGALIVPGLFGLMAWGRSGAYLAAYWAGLVVGAFGLFVWLLYLISHSHWTF